MKYLSLSVYLLLLAITSSAQIQIGQDIDGEAGGDNSGASISMGNAYTVAVGSPEHDGVGLASGQVRIFELTGTNWIQKGATIEGQAYQDRFGISVSMPDANTVACGGPYNDGNGTASGHVQVYQWTGVTWAQKGNDIYGEFQDDVSGTRVEMPDPNTVAIGALDNDGGGTNAGHVRIFQWNGSSWMQKGQDLDGENSGDLFGWSISMSDSNTIAIGGRSNDGNGMNSGHVRVFDWTGSTWSQRGIDLDGEASNDASGYSLSMSDINTLAIGAPGNEGSGSDAGHVRVYKWNGSSWVQKGQDLDGENPDDWFGRTVSMPDSNTLAIGAFYYDGVNGENSGRVKVYKWVSQNWVPEEYFMDGEAEGDNSSYSLSMPDTFTLAIGAYRNGGNGPWSGHARVYKLKGIGGQVFHDEDIDCVQQPEENEGVEGLLGVINPGGILVQTNSDGKWYLDSLPLGVYTLTYDTSSLWVPSCAGIQTFEIIDPDTDLLLDPFPVHLVVDCSVPQIGVNMPFIRPCFSNQMIYVEACNSAEALQSIDSAYIEIELDPWIQLDAASLPYLDLGNNQFQFFLDTLGPDSCMNLQISTTVDCEVDLGRTLCLKAELLPLDSCSLDTIPYFPEVGVDSCLIPYDGSHIKVDGWCENDSIFFVISNSPEDSVGDMLCYSSSRLFIDGVFIHLDSLILASGESDTLKFSGDGRTWRLEVDQHPHHPGASHPSITIELCGDIENWTSDLVNIYSHDDIDLHRDIFCGVVTASYDPNDKIGYPLGLTEEHWIAPNGSVDYRIRFQNTGTDTAFTVVVRDTLDTDLDIFSVESGVSSHIYDFQIYGPRVLQWTFSNIMLPDSGVDYEGSNGFVMFHVNQLVNLPDSTEITNSAAIYFDFNEPIITNTSSHNIMREVLHIPWSNESTLVDSACTAYFFGGYEYSPPGTYYQLNNDTLVTLIIGESSFSPNISLDGDSPMLEAVANDAIYQWLDCSNGFTAIAGASDQSFTATQNGSYAVAVTQMTCTDTSACITVDNVSILENQSGNGIRVFPNPTAGEVTIDLGISRKNVVVDVSNSLGEKVLESSVSNTRIMDLSLPEVEGLYFIRILEDSKPIGNLRVVNLR